MTSLCCLAQPAPVSEAKLYLGTAWYPEQWPASRWEADLSLMQAAHMNVVRVGEFAWSTMEPSEGHYDFGWLDRAIALAAKHSIKVVLGTPTAAPPAWLTSKYPDTLRVEEDGRRAEHGNRQQFSATSPRYRLLAAGIAREMARRYGHNPDVIGWQIDNEISAPTFDVSAKQQWHVWLRRKYGKIGTLNERWTTAYWSQTYDNFDQVPFHSRNENPALLLDYKRFMTDTWNSYLQNQVRAIRPLVDPRQFITTNTMHWNESFDHYVVHKGLDLAAWDDYFPSGHLDPTLNAIEHDLVRGYKRENFWVMETQPAFVNWGPINAALPPGVVREMAWQAVGHGADAVLYWQWRSAFNGQEQYHGSLLGADGLPVPVYTEIQGIGAEFARAAHAITGTGPHATVALINDYDSRWAIEFQRHTREFDYTGLLTEWYGALQPLTQAVDVVSANAPLDGYKVVFAPALNVLPAATAQHLREFVEHGGVLVLGPRSGMKNGDDALQPDRQPGPLEDLLGARVEQFYALDKPVPLLAAQTQSAQGTASVWAEQMQLLHPGSADVLLRYGAGNGWLAGKPAAVMAHAGSSGGAIYYFGAWMDAQTTRAEFASILGPLTKPLFPNVPDSVEVNQRLSPDGRRSVLILINRKGDADAHFSLPRAMSDVLAGGQTSAIDLPPHGVAVLESTSDAAQ